MGFSGFTADQFKKLITIFSIPSLHGILTGQHLECWWHFVLACRILCRHSLSLNDITLAGALLMQFCRRMQHLYGELAVTPNIHMHAHLREDLLNFGPVYDFWLFSFEWLKGILGSQPTNGQLPEKQLMNRFLNDNSAYTFPFPKSSRMNSGRCARLRRDWLDQCLTHFIIISLQVRCSHYLPGSSIAH